MKPIYFVAVALTALFLLSSGGLLFASASAYSSQHNSHNSDELSYQPVNLQFGGMIASAGSQAYYIQQSGSVVSATVSNMIIDPTHSHLDYKLNANVQGLSASGNANFRINGATQNGKYLDISGHAKIFGLVPAVCFPTLSRGVTCTSKDTSVVPAFFLGNATIAVTVESPKSSGISSQSPIVMKSVPMLFESAYLNPFGASIVFGTADNFASMLVISHYSHAAIDWDHVVLTGQIGGTSGKTAVTGTYTQITNEHENLVSGVAQDHGLMRFSNVVNAVNGHDMHSMDVSGHFSGISLIPSTPNYECLTINGNLGQCSNSDCSPSIGFLPGSGVCTNTGFESMGTFNLRGPDSYVGGTYTAVWSSPAFVFAAFATGTLINH